MNWFGMFFTFMIPGIAIGIIAAAAFAERSKGKRRRTGSRAAQSAPEAFAPRARKTRAAMATPAKLTREQSAQASEQKDAQPQKNKLFVYTLSEDAA